MRKRERGGRNNPCFYPSSVLDIWDVPTFVFQLWPFVRPSKPLPLSSSRKRSPARSSVPEILFDDRCRSAMDLRLELI